MDISSKILQYSPGNLIPHIDESETFIDFALKTGHPIITDYSRMNREIIVKNGSITLGAPKKKIQIKSIDELRKVLAKLLLQVYKAQFMTKDYVVCKSLMLNPGPSHTHEELLYQLSSKNKDIWNYIIDQVVFDILYDKYRNDSPCLTLNDFCTNYIPYDWDHSIYDGRHSEYCKVTPALHRECLNLALKVFTGTDDAMLEAIENLAKKIRSCESLRKDCQELNEHIEECPKECRQECIGKHLKGYFYYLQSKLLKKKDATYKAMIEEINREIHVMSNPLLKEDVEKLGVDPDLFFKYLDKRNVSWKKDVKKPKFVWDHLYFNGCPDLITSKQYKRKFKRDSNNSYQRFIDDFNRYDTFIETILPKSEDVGYEYFCKSMDFYHLEIYKRLDFIYRLALKFEDTTPTEIDKAYFLIKRFHPVVIWLDIDAQNNCPRYDERYKYYRPLLFLENHLIENDKLNESTNSDVFIEYNIVRAKIYELFTFNYAFVSNDYNDISDFIRNHYNMQSYAIKNKEWNFVEYRKKRYKKARIENVLMINNALFGKRKSNKNNTTIQ